MSLANQEYPVNGIWLANQGFVHVQQVNHSEYFSSTTYATDTSTVWVFDVFTGGNITYQSKSNSALVWAVRGN
jgi:hypothetical protein